MTPTLAVVMVLMGIAIGWMARGWDDLRQAKRAMKGSPLVRFLQGETISREHPAGWGSGGWSSPGTGGTVSSSASQTMRFYMAICHGCGGGPEGAAIPFSDRAERDRWMSIHTEGTGHAVDAEVRVLTESGVIKPVNIGEDLVMHNEMFMASPDGQTERERIARVLDEHGTPGTIEFNGYFTDGRDDRG